MENELYDLATGAPGCGGERALRLVAVSNRFGSHREPALIEPSCGPHLGAGINSVAAGGSEIFFGTAVDGHSCADEGPVRAIGWGTDA